MKSISVDATKPYRVHIGSGMLSSVPEAIRALTKAKTVCIVSDSNVFPIYGNTLSGNLQKAGYDVCHFVFAAGENSKSFSTYLELLNYLSEHSLTRSDCILALGGGVVGDLAGFAAATYLRGIAYIQVPTSLLAMVDSSVGGKTGINLTAGKNLAGAFWQPVTVLCDTTTLQTLPAEHFRDGCAEIIKYGILYDTDLFAHLEETCMDFDLETVIARCVELKRDVVAQDERESGARKLLNLGHTIGHAIEKCSNYSVSHGKAVAIGMSLVCRGTHCPDSSRITTLLQQFGLPVSTGFSADDLYTATLTDKKRSGDTIDLIIPMCIGHCNMKSIPVEDLKTLIKEGI